MTWREDALKELDKLRTCIDSYDYSVIEFKGKVLEFYKSLPATIGSGLSENDDIKNRLDELERKYELMFKDLYEFRNGIKRLLD